MAKKILVIDDDNMILGTLRRLLKSENYNVATAQSGFEALNKIRKESFDLIITDIRMPGLDGIDTLGQINIFLNESNKPLIPTLVITGYDSPENRKSAEKLKVAGYLTKPFDLKELLTNIEKNIKR